MNINLFTGWFYEPTLSIREDEFDFCYKKNKQLKFNNIIINTTKAPTFNNYFKEMEKYPNDINIIANPDNFFDAKFLDKLYNLYSNYKNKEKLCLGLTRWNYISEDNIFFQNTSQSQDVFIFYGSVHFDIKETIKIGVPGSDNRMVAILIYKLKMNVYNPSKDLKYYHYHPSGDTTRVYLDEKLQIKYKTDGLYEFLEPCSINDIKNN